VFQQPAQRWGNVSAQNRFLDLDAHQSSKIRRQYTCARRWTNRWGCAGFRPYRRLSVLDGEAKASGGVPEQHAFLAGRPSRSYLMASSNAPSVRRLRAAVGLVLVIDVAREVVLPVGVGRRTRSTAKSRGWRRPSFPDTCLHALGVFTRSRRSVPPACWRRNGRRVDQIIRVDQPWAYHLAIP
jgi:hypothetical protein